MEERRHYLYSAAYSLINQSQFLHPIRSDFNNHTHLSGPIRRELITNGRFSSPIRNEFINNRQVPEPMRSIVTQLPPHLRLPPSIEQKMNNISRLSGPKIDNQKLLPFNVHEFS